jgi:hypothetical protein
MPDSPVPPPPPHRPRFLDEIGRLEAAFPPPPPPPRPRGSALGSRIISHDPDHYPPPSSILRGESIHRFLDIILNETQTASSSVTAYEWFNATVVRPPAPPPEPPMPTPPAPEPRESECVHCACTLSEETRVERDPDDGWCCGRCFERLCTESAQCNSLYFNYELQSASDTENGESPRQVCRDCYFTCDHCNDRFYGESRGNRGTYCCSCYQEHITSCYSCRREIRNDQAHWDEENEEDYCYRCYNQLLADRNPSDEDDEEAEHGVRHEHDYTPRLQFRDVHDPGPRTLPHPSAIYFGLEIEVEFPHGWGISSANPLLQQVIGDESKWYGKYDGSLDNGVELVSHPATLAYWRKEGFAWARTLGVKGFRAWNASTCGIHIHVSRDALTPCEWLRAAAFFRDSVPLIQRMGRRPFNNYCQVHTNERTLDLRMKVDRRSYPDGTPGARYQALNFVPGTTVEFRMFRSTLRPSSILRNLECVNSVIEFARACPLPHMNELRYLLWLQHDAHSIPSIGAKRADVLRHWLDPLAPANLLDRWKSTRSTSELALSSTTSDTEQ